MTGGTGELAPDAALSALRSLAAHGRRYRIEAGEPPAGAAEWLPADRLLDPASPELSRLLDTEYHGSGHRTEHAAALTLIAVYAGRVTAAAVLHWGLTGQVLDVAPHNLVLRPDPGHGIAEVRLRAPRLLPADTGVQQAVLEEHLLPLAAALHRRTRAGLRQLRGGVAHGCATALGASLADPAPDPRRMARRWADFTRGAPGGLAALGDVRTVTRADGRSRLVYLRRTCCLFYTSAEAVRCASCCLTSTDERLAAYRAGPRPT